MDTTEILVTIGGVVLIVFVLWYFFGEREQVAAEQNESGLQEVKKRLEAVIRPMSSSSKKARPCV